MSSNIDKSSAFILIQQYINGWKNNDVNGIINTLADKVIIIESHGPKYIGINAVKHWFELWKLANSIVHKWEIKSFNFCEENQIAFCEWDFACSSDNQEYILSGISLIKFYDNKICHIHEYRMTKAEYLWMGKCLNSI